MSIVLLCLNLLSAHTQADKTKKAYAYLKQVPYKPLHDLKFSEREKLLYEQIQDGHSLDAYIHSTKNKARVKKDIRHLADKIKKHKAPPSMIVKYKKTIIILIFIILLILCLRYSPLQESMIFPGAYSLKQRGTDENLAFFTASDSTKLSYKYHEEPTSHTTIIYFGGNADTAATENSHTGIKNIGQVCKANVYMFDRPGYGRSEGSISSEQQFYKNAQDFYTHIKSKAGKQKIFLMGESLGGAEAIHLASKNPVDGLITRSTFTSIYNLICEKISTPLAWLLIRYELNSLEKIKEVKCPILLFHGNQDSLIPMQHGQKLYEACKSNATLTSYPGRHNDVPSDFHRQINDFINTD